MGKFYAKVTLMAFALLFFNSSIVSQNNDFKIVIDPGHGGKDSGNRGTGKYRASEKQIALEVSLLLGELIAKNLRGVEVVYTRKTDRFVSLNARSKLANKEKADLFISIHCNYVSRSSPYGTETFVMGLHKTQSNFEIAKKENSVIFLEQDYKVKYEGFDPNSPESFIGLNLFQKQTLEQSLRIAKYVEDAFSASARRKSRGVKQAGFWVISKNIMPSILIELGFLTNRTEEDFLHSTKGKKSMAEAIFEAFSKYYKEWKKKNESSLDNRPSQLEEPKVKQEYPKVKQEYPKVKQEYPKVKQEYPKVKQEYPKVKQKDCTTEICYHVQIFASKHWHELDDSVFRGLDSIKCHLVNGLYKYTTRSVSTHDEALNILKAVHEKGLKDAFIVAIKDGKRVPLLHSNRK